MVVVQGRHALRSRLLEYCVLAVGGILILFTMAPTWSAVIAGLPPRRWMARAPSLTRSSSCGPLCAGIVPVAYIFALNAYRVRITQWGRRAGQVGPNEMTFDPGCSQRTSPRLQGEFNKD
ncbi:hypothetical protein BH23ACT4_BH23ACT4_04500 [soil metagenome]